MLQLTRPLKRSAAAVLATAVAASGMAVLAAAPAQAAEIPDLQWKISNQFANHLSTHVLADGATEDATTKVVTFPTGTGKFDTVTGEASIQYDGSVSGSFINGGTTFYTVTIADPKVTVDATGNGEISAEVSASNAAQGPSPAASTTPARVVVSRFSSPGWTLADGLGSITATPTWTNVIAPDTPASAAAGLPAGKPFNGEAFAPEFFGQLTPGVKAHFYNSGTADQPNKAPQPFTAEASPAANLTNVVQSASYANGVSVKITGANYDTTWRPGATGIYAGVIESGKIMDVAAGGQGDGMALFAASTYLPSSAITAGGFVTGLVVPTNKLVKGKSYSVYTWTAHGNPTAGDPLLKESVITIPWDKLKAPVKPPVVKKKATTTAVKFAKRPTKKKPGSIVATVRSGKAAPKPAGKVTVRIVKAGKVRVVTKRVNKAGKVTVKLTKGKGITRVTVRYLGNAKLKASKSKTIRVRVR